MTSRELEWFDLETRMREVLHMQLMPLMTKSKEDRDQINTTRSHISKLESRIKELENMVFGDKDNETVMQEIFSKFAENEGNRKKDNIKVEQELTFINEKIKSLNFNINEANESLSSLTKRVKKNEEEVNKLELVVEHNKESTMKEMDNIGKNFRDLNATYTNIAIRSEEKALAASDKAKAISIEIGMYKRELEVIWKSHNEMIHLTRDCKANKLEIDQFAEYKDRINEKFKQISDSLVKVSNEFSYRDLFIDKFFPMKIATMISDYLYNTFEQKTLYKLPEYETNFLMKLNADLLNGNVDSRDTQVQTILNDIKHVEERKSKFPRILPKKKSKKRPTLNIDVEVSKEAIEAMPKEPNPVALTDEFEEGVIEKLVVKLNFEVAKIKNELNKKLDNMTSNILSRAEDSSILLKQVIDQLEEKETQQIREKIELKNEFKDIKDKIEEVKTKNNEISSTVQECAKVNSYLIEAFKIQQALDSQDEDDRHGIAQHIEKDLMSDFVMAQGYSLTIPSANFSLKKNCIACGQTTSMLSGIRTSVVYQPSPLMYRQKVFNRPDLLEIKGKIIEKLISDAGEVVSTFENASKEMRKSSMPVLSKESELHSLNISSSRNRSHKRSRLMVKSAVNSVDKYQM